MIARVAQVFVVLLVLSSCRGVDPQSGDQMIDVGTHRLHLHCEGQGAPTVVIDVGIASTSDEWLPLLKQLAETTHVCTYDRAGYGQSEPGPHPRDSGRAADELRALLRAASVHGPYVLVGHSLGALNMQIYAVRYPDDVAGMILLDPPPLGWILGEFYPDLRQMAERMTDEWQAIADARSESSDPRVRTEAAFFSTIASEHREMLGRSASLAAAIETFGDIPVTVIASGVPNPMFGDIAEEYQQYWIEQSRTVAGKSTRGKFVLAEESSHHLHTNAPTVVREAILSLVQDLRRR